MKQKIIMLAGVGGAAGVGFARCLLKDDRFYVYGYDSSPWGERMANKVCDTTPFDPNHADMIVPIPDPLVRKYAECDLSFLPSKEVIELCQDKALTAVTIKDLAPKTYWVRATSGAGGLGAEMQSEYLPGKNYSVEMIWLGGKYNVGFMKERLSYKVGKVEPSVIGVGSSAVSQCVWKQDVFDVARKAVLRVTPAPHGIFSVDLKCNDRGEPKVTEINPGRFLTASYDFYRHGFNLPLHAVSLFLGLDTPSLGEYPEGKVVIRQTGQDSWYGDAGDIRYPINWLKGAQ